MVSEVKFKETEIGMIPEDWEIKNVEEITDTVCVGFVGTCLQYYCDQSEGIPMIRTTNLTDSGVCYSDLKYVTKEFHNKNKKSQLKKGDLVVARHGDNGKICIFEGDFEANCLNIVKIRPDNAKCNNKYLHYAFKNNLVLYQISSSVVGSVQGVLNTKTIAKLKIPLPSIEEQTKIIYILKSLDDKIDLNRQMNSTLEKIAQTLFKRWFIDFEFPDKNGNPYNSSGGRMVDSELGEIPEGWEAKQIGDICETFGGGTPKTSEPSYWEEGDVYWATPTDMTSLNSPVIFDTSRKITEKGLQNSSARLLPAGSILMTSRATLGYFAIAKVPISTNQGFISMVCDDRISKYYLLNAVQNKMEEIENLASGSTFLEINKTSFRSIKIILPPKSIMKKFDEVADSIYERIFQNEMEINRLAEIRDSLLPKLMSGKIRISTNSK